MKTLKHTRPVTKTPEYAQISNFQVKLDFTSAVIDRLLLADRQRGWKLVPGGSTDIDDITDGGVDIPTGLI